jgi:DNA invertase Pin-like site-specific DNA recombinase
VIVGYARVSTIDQDTAIQVAALRKCGCDRIDKEKGSGVKVRPVFEKLLASVKRGDTVVVHKLDRLARSMLQFVRVLELLKQRGVRLVSLTETIDTETPHGRMVLQIIGVFAEFERELIRERCLAGQIAARAAGKTWGVKRRFVGDDAAYIAKVWRTGYYTIKTIAYIYDSTESTIRDTVHYHEKRGRYATKGLRQ